MYGRIRLFVFFLSGAYTRASRSGHTVSFHQMKSAIAFTLTAYAAGAAEMLVLKVFDHEGCVGDMQPAMVAGCQNRVMSVKTDGSCSENQIPMPWMSPDCQMDPLGQMCLLWGPPTLPMEFITGAKFTGDCVNGGKMEFFSQMSDCNATDLTFTVQIPAPTSKAVACVKQWGTWLPGDKPVHHGGLGRRWQGSSMMCGDAVFSESASAVYSGFLDAALKGLGALSPAELESKRAKGPTKTKSSSAFQPATEIDEEKVALRARIAELEAEAAKVTPPALR